MCLILRDAIAMRDMYLYPAKYSIMVYITYVQVVIQLNFVAVSFLKISYFRQLIAFGDLFIIFYRNN